MKKLLVVLTAGILVFSSTLTIVESSDNPTEACSQTDFTIYWPPVTGRSVFRSFDENHFGMGSPALRRNFLVSSLFDVKNIASVPAPVYGSLRESRIAGAK